jgi:hypothetical protein
MYAHPPPSGPITQTDIVAADGQVKHGLQIGVEYEIVPRAVWDLLHLW